MSADSRSVSLQPGDSSGNGSTIFFTNGTTWGYIYMKNDFGKNFEKKFSKYAIPNLSLYLIICYAFGYLIQVVNAGF